MRPFMKKIKSSPIFIVVLIIIVFFMPQNLAEPPESVRNAIVTAVGVDKIGEEIELSFLAFVATQGTNFTESYKVSSTKGNSLSEAMQNAGLQQGKEVRLFHTETAILGSGVVDSDVAQILDYLSREASLSKSCMLVGTNQEAKGVLEFLQKQDKNPADKLNELMLYNTEYIYWGESTLESFYSGYYSPTKSSFMAYLSLEEDENGILLDTIEGQQNSSEGSGGSSGGGASGESSQQNKTLKNQGSVLLFREGKRVDLIDLNIINGINWVVGSPRQKTVTLDNFTDREMTDARVIYYIDDKNVIKSVRFENRVPIYSADIKIYIDKVEINGDKQDLEKNIDLSDISPEAQVRIKHIIKSEFARAVNKLRENKTDVMGVYNSFYQRDRKKFKNFLKNLENQDDFLDYIIFEINIHILAD